MEETWKDIPGYEGKYQASTHGRVRSLRVLSPIITSGNGYLSVVLTGQEKHYVHALIAKTFIGPPELGQEVNHIDGNRKNPRPENLEYVTHTENMRHMFRIGNRKLYFTEEQMNQIADLFFREGMPVLAISRIMAGSNPTQKHLDSIRKRVRSVIGIWRASQRPKGYKNPHEYKLDAVKVSKMRELYKTGNATLRELGRMFGVHPAHASRVVRGVKGYFAG